MANLKGGNYEKQIKDASIRMNKIGEKKENDGGSHSVRTHKNRQDMLKDFAKFATKNDLDNKLNSAMSATNIGTFFDVRLDGLKASTTENYIRNFGAMVENLKANNIEIKTSSSDFNSRIVELKSEPVEIIRGRNIENVDTVINKIYDRNFDHGTTASVQNELGLRVSEAVEVVNNLDKYLKNDGKLHGIIGKGGREYIAKEISMDLIAKIELAEKVDKRDYQRTLESENIKSHDFRYTYAKQKNEDGFTKSEISLELNHNREEITDYYLSRA